MDITGRTAADDKDEPLQDHEPALDLGSPDSDLTPGASFRDHKAPGAFRTIGEVASTLGIRQHVLRYWEEQFPMLTPIKRSGNRRYYRPEDVALIEKIDRLVHHEGYTLRGARLALDPAPRKTIRGAGDAPGTTGPADTANAGSDVRSATQPWLEELLAIRAALVAALAG